MNINTVLASRLQIVRSLMENIVIAAQFPVLTFRLFKTLTFISGESVITAPDIPLMWRPQKRSVSSVQPIFVAMEQIAAR